ncbi:MAG: nucleoside triphosphate pyrophosphohydrolase [Myxococcota bacterium]
MTHARLEHLLELMAKLRSPEGGCPWDLEQSFRTIAPYTIEEAYEVDDAIRREDWPDLREELGDLLLQVVFHAQLARESGLFAFGDVVETLCEKLVRRHPHVFGDASVADADEVLRAWELHKQAERAARGADLRGEVPLALPALLRAAKLARRATRSGVAEPAPDALAARVDAELSDGGAERFGEFLLALAARAGGRGIDPEAALREACARFESRELAGRKKAASP